MHIRPIEPRDNPAVAGLVRGNLEKYGLNIPGTAYCDPMLDNLSMYYSKKPEDMCYYVLADDGNCTVGGAGLERFSGFEACAELQKLYLAEDYKGKGYGRMLLEYIEEKAREMGFRRMYLETHSALIEALRLYEKAGYRRIEKPVEAVHSTMDRFLIKEL